MSRKLDLTEFAVTERKTGQVARSTSWAFAAAVSVLLIATLVINRSTTAVGSDHESTLAFSYSGFELDPMLSGETRRHCLDLESTDGVRLDDVSLNVAFDGYVNSGMNVAIISGESPVPGSCENFSGHVTMFDGTIEDLAGSPLVLDQGDHVTSIMVVINNYIAPEDEETDGVLQFWWEANAQ